MIKRAYWAWGGLALFAVTASCGNDEPDATGAESAAGSEISNTGGAGGSQEAKGGAPEQGFGGSVAAGAGGEAPSGGGAIGEGGAPPVAGAGGGAPTNAVHGRVYNGTLPRAGLVVLIDGVLAKTDRDGRFTVDDVAEEYELLVTDPQRNQIAIYDALKTRAPVVHLGYPLAQVTNTATVSGKISGGSPLPLPASVTTRVSYRSKTRGELASQLITPPAAFQLTPTWYDPGQSDDGEILVIQTVTNAKGAPLQYTGIGRRDVSITNGAIVGSTAGSPLTDVALTSAGEYAVSGNLTLPQGWSRSGDELRFGNWSAPAFVEAGSFSLHFPDLAEAPKRYELNVVGMGTPGNLPGASMGWPAPDAATSTWDREVPAPLTMLTPAADASGVNLDTVFSWTKPPTGYVSLMISICSGWAIERVTMKTDVTLFDLRQFGLPFPTGQKDVWAVDMIGPATTIDDTLIALDSLWMHGNEPYARIWSAGQNFVEAPP